MRKLLAAATLVAALALSSPVLAAAPAFVPVQGFLTDGDGRPVSGEVFLTFRLWDQMTGGQALFTEVQEVLVEDGFFTLYLGGAGSPALDLALFRDQGALFLGLQVGTEEEMAPRLPLGAVPYAGFAQHAGDAATVGGRSADEFRLGADAILWDDLAGVPEALLDGDADSLAGIVCNMGDVLKWSGTGWECAVDATGSGATEAEVDAYVANNGYALQAELAPVAFSGDWSDLVNVPAALLDGDADTLAGIACADGQVVKAIGGVWACADDLDTDTTLDEAAVDAMVADNGYALQAELAPVAFSGAYADLLNAPADQDTLARLTCADGQLPAWDEAGTVWECVDDRDTDTLRTLACMDGQVAKWDELLGAWGCADDLDTDTSLTEAEVDAMVADNGYALEGHEHDAAYVNEGQASSVTSGMIVDESIHGGDILDGSIGLNDVNTGSLDARYALNSHDHDATYVNEGQANSVTSAMILDATITSGDIQDGTLTTSDIATDTLLAADIAAGAVTSSEILDSTITTTDIAADTITAGDIATGAVGTTEILDATIVGADVAVNALGMREISPTGGSILQGSGTLVAGDNYIYSTATFTPSVSGTCWTSIHVRYSHGSIIAAGAAQPFVVAMLYDGINHFVGSQSYLIDNVRSATVQAQANPMVSAGTTYQFGAYIPVAAGSSFIGVTVYVTGLTMCW